MDEEVEISEVKVYISSLFLSVSVFERKRGRGKAYRFGPPQYSVEFPSQSMLQDESVTGTLPACKVFPQ